VVGGRLDGAAALPGPRPQGLRRRRLHAPATGNGGALICLGSLINGRWLGLTFRSLSGVMWLTGAAPRRLLPGPEPLHGPRLRGPQRPASQRAMPDKQQLVMTALGRVDRGFVYTASASRQTVTGKGRVFVGERRCRGGCYQIACNASHDLMMTAGGRHGSSQMCWSLHGDGCTNRRMYVPCRSVQW
jgi:hypothetical protein